MKCRRLTTIFIAAMLSVATLACAVVTTNAPATEMPGLVQTSVYQTVFVVQTVEAFNTLVVKLTDAARFTATPIPPTVTPVTPSATPVPPTQTPTATNTAIPPTQTSTPTSTAVLPCLRAEFIADVTVPDGTLFSAGTNFVKTWRLKNTGSCAWTSDFRLAFISGSSMGGPAAVPINTNVLPGQQVDISVSLVAPATSGDYSGNWMLRSPNNINFGLGTLGNKPFYVRISVQNSSASWNYNTPLDFAAQYCTAAWRNNATALPCPSAGQDFANGSITRTTTPILEGGYQDDEPAIILVPGDGPGGTITGRYPKIKIQNNDRFTALIGCLNNSPSCNVLFQLNFVMDNGPVQSLGGWVETYDGNWQRLDVNLSGLAGKDVEFILTAMNNNGTSLDDRLFILAPIIKR